MQIISLIKRIRGPPFSLVDIVLVYLLVASINTIATSGATFLLTTSLFMPPYHILFIAIALNCENLSESVGVGLWERTQHSSLCENFCVLRKCLRPGWNQDRSKFKQPFDFFSILTREAEWACMSSRNHKKSLAQRTIAMSANLHWHDQQPLRLRQMTLNILAASTGLHRVNQARKKENTETTIVMKGTIDILTSVRQWWWTHEWHVQVTSHHRHVVASGPVTNVSIQSNPIACSQSVSTEPFHYNNEAWRLRKALSPSPVLPPPGDC